MCFQGEEGEISWVSRVNKGNWGKPKQDRSNTSDGATEVKKRRPKDDKKIDLIEQIYFKISRKELAIFEVLKSAEVFQWGPTQQKAFQDLKQYLIEPTTLTPPSSGAPLPLYVAASNAAVSAALLQEKQDGQAKKQVTVYFISEVLSPSKKNYTELEKVLYDVLMASRKLRHYFQSYHIIVTSSQPLMDIIRYREATWWVGKWAAELNEFTIDYVHRSLI
jgi:hypothetical protein